MSETLVLSAGYEPIGRTSWKRAIRLWLRGAAEIVKEYEDRWVTFEIKMPCVVRLLNFVLGNSKRPRFSRENVYVRDHQKCQYCGKKVSRDGMTYDHVTPRSQGGQTSWENVVVCCIACNQRKANRTPNQAKMRLTQEPVRPKHLPKSFRFPFRYEKGMPIQMVNALRDLG